MLNPQRFTALTILCVVLIFSAFGAAQEKIVLVTPVQVSVGATEFSLWYIDLRRAHPDRPAGGTAIFREVGVTGFIAGGRSVECRYEGEVAQTLIRGLNKANLSVGSLEKRVTQRCQADKQFGDGVGTGDPE